MAEGEWHVLSAGQHTPIVTLYLTCSIHIPINTASNDLIALVQRIIQNTSCLVTNFHSVREPLDVTHFSGVSVLD